jgi:transposase-like protein
MTLNETSAPEPIPPPLANGAGNGAVSVAGRAELLTIPNRPHLPPIRRHSDETIARARRLVEETTRSIVDIARELGIGQATLGIWMHRNEWERPEGAPRGHARRRQASEPSSEAHLLRRLRRVFGRQLAALEARTKGTRSRTMEKDARTLGVLAKTLETLKALDRDGAKVTKPEPVDRGHLRLELARKIAAWAEQEVQPGPADPAAK